MFSGSNYLMGLLAMLYTVKLEGNGSRTSQIATFKLELLLSELYVHEIAFSKALHMFSKSDNTTGLVRILSGVRGAAKSKMAYKNRE